MKKKKWDDIKKAIYKGVEKSLSSTSDSSIPYYISALHFSLGNTVEPEKYEHMSRGDMLKELERLIMSVDVKHTNRMRYVYGQYFPPYLQDKGILARRVKNVWWIEEEE